MSKDASDLFPPTDTRIEVILNRLRKNLPLTEWERITLKNFGVDPTPEFQGILRGLDFIQKYGGKPDSSNQSTGSYTKVKEAFQKLNQGYHTVEIPRGRYGERSKILEEMAEVEDAHAQGNSIMLMLELSDLVGATIGYLERHGLTLKDLQEYPGVPYQYCPFAKLLEAFNKFRSDHSKVGDFRELDEILWLIGCYVMRWSLSFSDVLRMTETTHRAFESGHRKPKEAA